MRGTVAKRLRKQAQAATVGSPAKDLRERRHQRVYRHGGKAVVLTLLEVRHASNSTRAVYQQLKRAYYAL